MLPSNQNDENNFKCLIPRELVKKNRKGMEIFGGSGGYAAVSSQFHIVPNHKTRLTK